FPIGYLIAWMCNDELVSGRKWFRIIIFVSLLVGIVSLFFGQWVLLCSMIFIFIVTSISLRQSFNKKWVKRRI
ncbi:MAG: hypothetical protein WCK29_03350, partial [archaeon]